MSVWYEVEKTEQGLANFMGCNWEFHDFRPERVEYVPGKDMVEIFLKYDTMDQGVLLRFSGIHDMHINTHRDYDADWLSGSTIMCLEDDSVIWLDDENYGDISKAQIDDMKRWATWVEAEWLFWAVTDAEGNPVEMPQDRIHQIGTYYGTKVEKHFQLKEFQGDIESPFRWL